RHESGDGWDVVAAISEDPERARLTRRIVTFRRLRGRWRRSAEVHRVRLWRREEISALLSAAGLESAIGGAYGSFRLPHGHLVALARKPPAARSRNLR